MDLPAKAYTIDLRLIGIDSALGALEAQKGHPVEVGAFVIVTAPTQDDATEIAKLINPFLLHYPLTKDEELPTFAFPYSLAHSELGALFEFAMTHVVRLDSPMQAFRLTVDEVRHDPNRHAPRRKSHQSPFKNAGLFWVTIDIFCGNQARYDWLSGRLSSADAAALYHIAPEQLKRFEIDSLNVIKFSFPRPIPQGAPLDRDQQGRPICRAARRAGSGLAALLAG